MNFQFCQVGDIVKIQVDEHFPADVVLLASSEPDGICYVETANLDGETNLKVRQSLSETSHITTPQLLHDIRGTVVCEQPNNSLYTFEGVLKSNVGDNVPIGPNQVLLRVTAI